jgi:hypothetical protein
MRTPGRPSFRKVSTDEHEVMKRRRINNRNFYVSSYSEEFSCEAAVSCVGVKNIPFQVIGLSKMEHRVSDKFFVDICRGFVSGG